MNRRELTAAGIGAGVVVLIVALGAALTAGPDAGADANGVRNDVTAAPSVRPASSLGPVGTDSTADPDAGSTGGASDGMEVEDGEPEKAPPPSDAPEAGKGPLPVSESVECPAATVPVATTDELSEALGSVGPGDTIELAPGRYVGNFVAMASGTADEPIFLCGSEEAVLDGGDTESGYVLHLDGASHWRLVGFLVTNGQKGLMADRTVGTVIQDLTVSTIGDEAIHLRNQSTDNVVLDNSISDTGRRRDKYGEGVYIGTAVSNWCTFTACKVDRSDRNVVKGNTITDVTSEAVDAKEGTIGGVIIANTFDGSAVTGADSWVDVKGNNWLVADNVGKDAPEDGFQTHEILTGWGDHNLFTRNQAEVNGPGHAISSWPPGSNVVTCDNDSSSAGEGLSNIACK